jgi:CheY-like chemotaxis protein
MSGQRPITVLMVEDSVDDVFLARTALGRSGYDVALAVVGSVQAAVQWLNDHPQVRADLLLLDLNLPAEPGFELLRVLRLRPEVSPGYVAVFSSSTMRSDEDTAISLGADCFVTKPPRFSQLVETLQGLLALADKRRPA